MLSRQALAPHGVAAIAYLTYPGWKQREALRELLTMRSPHHGTAETRLEESASLLRFLDSAYASRPDDPHAASLLAVTRSMRSTPQNAFVHDELGPVHDPCYFVQFVEWAQECGLAFLAEADLGTMSVDGLAPTAARELDLLAPDLIETQQLIDFVVNRSGRASLLVRSDAVPDHKVGPDRLAALRFGSRWWKVTPLNAPTGTPDRFESPDGQSLETSDPAVRHVLGRLCRDHEATFSLAELAQDAPGFTADELQATATGLVARGVIEPRAASPHRVQSVTAPTTTG